MTLWQSAVAAGRGLERWLRSPQGRIQVARLPRAAWPIVAGAIARAANTGGRSLLVLVQSPDRFIEELRPWLAGRPQAFVFAEVGTSFLDRPPAFDPAVNQRLAAIPALTADPLQERSVVPPPTRPIMRMTISPHAYP